MPKKNQEEPRIGVYTCYCGGNISDVVDCEKVAQELKKFPHVVVSRTNMSMCSDVGQSIVEQDIHEKGVNRVVIGACAPSLHEQTFRGTAARAGLNPYFYHHVGLREQDSWVHGNDRGGATEKAIRLMAAGIAKARLLDPLAPFQLDAEGHALVIGGGIAGLRSALDIARRGLQVSLIEKSPFLGGRMAQLGTLFPSKTNARKTLQEVIQEVIQHPRITIFTQARVIDFSGYVGDYQVQIKQDSRGIEEHKPEELLNACQQEVPDSFNYGFTNRKIIYRAYPGCYPPIPAVDWKNYRGQPIELDGEEIVLENRPRTFDLNVGAVVVATGFDPYQPREGQYGFQTLPEVVTLPAFLRYLDLLEVGQPLHWNGHPVRDVALIHCVGSREIDGVHEAQPDGQVNNYCSRVCCTAALHLANTIKNRFPEINLYDFYEDIRTYGRGHEDFYHQALNNQVRFLRFHGHQPPTVSQAQEGDTHPVLIQIQDYLTNGEEIEVPVDLVVLAVGMMPRGIDDLVQMLKLSRGVDRFLLEVHPKLQPVETAVPGIVLAGTAQGPMTVQESCAAAAAAAAKISGLLSRGQVELEPFVAQVDLEKCQGTGNCVEVCEYEDAIALVRIDWEGETVLRAEVTPANCTGCGNCVSACPHQAIQVQGWTIPQYEAMVDAIALDLDEIMEVGR